MQNQWMLGLCGLAAGIACTLTAWGQEGQTGQTNNSNNSQLQALGLVDRAAAQITFRGLYPGASFYESVGRITKVYGSAFGSGQTPRDSAEQFRLNHAGIFGVPSEDIIAVPGFEGGNHLQPVMFQNGQYKFTAVNYSQAHGGLSVYRSRLILLARNEPGFPLVLATADVRDLNGFVVDQQALQNANARAGYATARKMMPQGTVFTQATPVIYAGVDDQPFPPTLALNFTGEGGDMAAGTFSRREFVTNASTGAILYTEDLVYHADVSGTVRGMVTDNFVADVCAPESLQPLPYLRVGIGATNVFADVNGNFTIPNPGTSDVTVTAPLIGQYFVVNNQQAATSSITTNVTPPGPVNLVHNEANATEGTRAEVNAYLHANLVRDLVVAANPVFPTVSTQSNFPVNVNIGQTCNAFYSASTINFYIAGGGCNNTSFGTVVHHEFGHNVVAKAGSGQGAYGEGMGDCLGVLVTDSPNLGLGFQSCVTPLRNANNNCQYSATSCSSCGSAIHSCGMLLSGCVWSLRNNLAATNPSNYREILSDLTVNSILLHTGTTITPQITIDFLTLADDDTDLSNGGPFRTEIADAFGAHGMPAPAINFLLLSYPNGRPSYINPNGSTVLRVLVSPGASQPAPGATLNVDVGSGYVAVPMTQVATNTYEAAFPTSTCGTTIKYYVSAQTTTATTVTSPSTAPTAFFSGISGAGLGEVVFADNFQSDLGWAVTNDAALTDGPWDRGTPISVATCNRGNPGVDGDGSGVCFVTDNSSANSCNSDVDGGVTYLLSPIMNASTGACVLSYWRWYDNVDPANANQDDPFRVDISLNGGTSWQNLEVVGPTGPETNGGWVFKSFSLNAVPGFTPTSQFRVRFAAQDTGVGSVVEAGVDGVSLQKLVCATAVPGDVNNDGSVDVTDLLAVIGAWGPCPGAPTPCPADVAPAGSPDGVVAVTDLLLVIANWT